MGMAGSSRAGQVPRVESGWTVDTPLRQLRMTAGARRGAWTRTVTTSALQSIKFQNYTLNSATFYMEYFDMYKFT